MTETSIFILGFIVILISLAGFVYTVIEFRPVSDSEDAPSVEHRK